MLPSPDMLDAVRTITAEAGRLILTHYGKPIPVEVKSDDSPLTQADRAAHHLLSDRLRALAPDVPVLSEESPAAEIAGREGWRRFWCVDPLDGTKEFIKGTGEFTVNVALIEDGEPVLGVVHVPVKGITYYAAKGEGAFKQVGGAAPERIHARAADAAHLTVVASRDHAGPAVGAFVENLKAAGSEVDLTSMGSSLKFCLVAEGAADLYPRTVPTMEWDTAAAQAVVEAAGGTLTTLDGERLRYNKPVLRNPSVLAAGGGFDWQAHLDGVLEHAA